MAVIHSSRNPFQLWLLGACVLSGAIGLSGGGSSSAIARLLPGWETAAWYGGLLLFGAIGLLGCWRPHLLVERVGMAGLCGLSLAYAIGIVSAVGGSGAFTASFIAAFAVACATRFVQINREMRAITRIAQDLRHEEEA